MKLLKYKVGDRIKMLRDPLAHCYHGHIIKRWRKGQTGTVVENDFSKYDYKVRFDLNEQERIEAGPAAEYASIRYFFAEELEALTR